MRTIKNALAAILAALLVISSVPMAAFAAAATPESFSDFPTGWSYKAMNEAVENGLINGFEDGTVRPRDLLTRAQMAAIINRAFGAEVKADITGKFADVTPDKWYYQDIEKAVNMRTFTGDDTGLMRPDEPITREDAMLVIARALVITGNDIAAVSYFKDGNDISVYARGAISAFLLRGYVHGYEDGTLKPHSYITREEFAQIMDNIFASYVRNDGIVVLGDNEGEVVLTGDNVILSDTTIYGDLIIGDGVGATNVTLRNVNIDGRLLFRGGEGLVSLSDVSIGTLIVTNDYNGTVNFNHYSDEAYFTNAVYNTPASFLNRTVEGGSVSGKGKGGHDTVIVGNNDAKTGVQPEEKPSYVGGSSQTGGGNYQQYYTLVYNYGYGNNEYASAAVGSGITVKAPTASRLTREGYTFVGWNTAPNQTFAQYEDANIPGAQVSSYFAYAQGTYTLYAVWQENQYKITYNANDKTTTTATQTFSYTDAVNSGVLSDLSAWENDGVDGYNSIIGWADSADAADKAYDTNKTLYSLISEKNLLAGNGGTTSEIDLYAIWKYTVTFKHWGDADTIVATVDTKGTKGLTIEEYNTKNNTDIIKVGDDAVAADSSLTSSKNGYVKNSGVNSWFETEEIHTINGDWYENNVLFDNTFVLDRDITVVYGFGNLYLTLGDIFIGESVELTVPYDSEVITPDTALDALWLNNGTLTNAAAVLLGKLPGKTVSAAGITYTPVDSTYELNNIEQVYKLIQVFSKSSVRSWTEEAIEKKWPNATPEENQVRYAYIDAFMYALDEEIPFDIIPETTFISEAIVDKLAPLAKDDSQLSATEKAEKEDLLETAKKSVPAPLIKILGDEKTREIFNTTLVNYYNHVKAVNDAVMADDTNSTSLPMDTNVTVIINPVEDVLKPNYDKYYTNNLQGEFNNNPYYSIYQNNAALMEAEQLLRVEEILATTASTDPEKSGWKLLSAGEYVNLTYEMAALLHSAGEWFIDELEAGNITEAQLDGLYQYTADRIGGLMDKAAEKLSLINNSNYQAAEGKYRDLVAKLINKNTTDMWDIATIYTVEEKAQAAYQKAISYIQSKLGINLSETVNIKITNGNTITIEQGATVITKSLEDFAGSFGGGSVSVSGSVINASGIEIDVAAIVTKLTGKYGDEFDVKLTKSDSEIKYVLEIGGKAAVTFNAAATAAI